MSSPLSVVSPARLRHRRIAAASVALGLALVGAGIWQWNQPSLKERLKRQVALAEEASHWDLVSELSRRLVRLDPDDGETWMTWARAAQSQGDSRSAAEYMEHVGQNSPQRMAALRGLVELQLGVLNAPLDAEQSLQEMLERDPSSTFARQRLIFYYAITFQRDKMIRHAREAMQRDSASVDAYVYLFYADSLHFTNGVPLNSRWLAGNPKSELFRVGEAIHLATALQGGAPRDDIDVVRRIRRMAERRDDVLSRLFDDYPRNLELLAWHAERAIEQGDVARVVALLGTLPPEADQDNRFMRYAGWAKAQAGLDDEAQQYYAEALRLNPLDWKTRHFLAELRRRQQDFAEVSRLEQIAQTADELRHALDVIPDAQSVPPKLLERLVDYATRCGDELYAGALRRRLARDQSASSEPGGPH